MNSTIRPSTNPSGHGVPAYLAMGALLGVIVTAYNSYLLFHSLAEIFSIVIGFGFFVVIWNGRHFLDNHYLLFLGIAFLFISGLDLIHTLDYKGMSVLSVQDANHPPQLWIAARFLEACSFLAAFWFIKRPVREEWVLLAFTGITALILAAIYKWRIFPTCFVDGVGLTPFKIISEYVICLLLGCGWWLFRRNQEHFDPETQKLLIRAMLATMGSELAFTFYVGMYDFSNLIGHILKILAFYWIYQATVENALKKPFSLLFREVIHAKDALILANQQLSGSQTLLEQAQEIAHLGHWHWDIPSGGLTWSREVYQILGLDPTAITPSYQLFLDLLHEQDRPLVVQAIEKTFNLGTPTYDVEHRIHCPNQEIRFVREKGMLIRDEQGQPRSMIGTVLDVTQQKRVEISLQEAMERVERANQIKSEFLANMSHEIRTPMNAIIGLCYLFFKTELSTKQQDYLKKIDTSAKFLLRLINDILDFSKIEAGKLEMEHEDFALAEILEQVSSVINVKIAEKGLNFSLKVAKEVPSWLLGDSLRLGQVLTNLTSNAVKFTQKGDVALEVELLDESEQGVTVRFMVRDSGIGMTPKQVEQLFQVFHQADASITRQYGGTGLGLAISKRLIEMMGGAIQVSSIPGEGSCFTFTACFGKSQAEHKTRSQEIPESRIAELLSGIRILLVEDNEINQQVARELLERVGVQVTVASNGQESLAWVAKERFDMILMDMQMPVMDGLTASQKLREEALIPLELPILAMTANVMTGDREKCLAAGMNDHIPKPIHPASLYATLLRWHQPADSPHVIVPSTLPGLAVEFPVLDGVDVQKGLNTLSGNVDFYRSILFKFVRNQSGVSVKMGEYWANRDTKALEHAAHTLKGVSATIGAMSLADMAATLEKQANMSEHWEDLPGVVAEISNELARVVTSIQTTLVQPDPLHDQTPVDVDATPEVLAPLFQQAVGLLLMFDASAEHVVEEICALVANPSRKEHVRLLRESLAVYDFEQCLAQLQAWACEEGISLEA
ncbi:MAG: ATP-binding protein [Magnetococcus sp. YQC-5]